ncbi:MAG: glycosyltransferase family 4 protein, partial [Bacteroidetes bacterium]|nr:glycosyltransferase family 4 protein [Bacteroidota bacterium]
KILILANHRKDRSPGQRFRFEQYIDFLNNNGFQCELSAMLDEEDDRIFYSKGNWLRKLRVILKCFRLRLNDVRRARHFDIVLVFREAFFTGTTWFERRLSKLPVKVVFDFDDSIWLPNVSSGNKRLEWLKNYEKTSELISLSDLVFAGNQYLANYALENNSNVVIIPTTIDTEEYQRVHVANSKVCIGWSGSITTIQHFEYAISFLKELKMKYGSQIEIKVIGDGGYINKELDVEGISWIKEDEVKELSRFDIGIMPLLNDEWSRGKCGLKGLQYMALEIPTVISPIGVNIEIIEHGINGFLADTKEEWVEKISLLIDSKELRTKMGEEARKTVIERYSFESQKLKYLSSFKSLLES